MKTISQSEIGVKWAKNYYEQNGTRKGFKFIEFATEYESWDELYDSEECKELWSGFCGREQAKSIAKKFEFIGAWKVNVDPKSNYGQGFKLYKMYRADGIRMFREITIHSCLHNGGMREVLPFEDGVVLTDLYFKKSKEARAYLRKADRVVM